MSSKLRKALLDARIALSLATHNDLNEDDAKDWLEVVDAALAEPLKNCEVGNDREQDLRFYDFCGSHSSCDKCPLKGKVYSCSLSWGQLPYESEENNG